ncbi:hypothetical protein FQR65_LT04486 [Abscondita terminalis]|nr:hypothetical protein FQR65_LT04486 [Abscondita terminalis]
MVTPTKRLHLCFRSCTSNVLLNLFKKKRCYSIYFILTVVFVIEILSYYYVAFLWYPIECEDNHQCTKILLVADPQLIGLQNEHIHILTPLSIWDSDWYLSNTYSHAYRFTQPDVVIFLGDLFDEGSTAMEKEFDSYVDRFYNIFEKDDIQYIWIPGDNDIGGEYADYITSHKIERFFEAFPQEDVVIYKNIRFNKINRLINQAPIRENAKPEENYTDIALSHLSLLSIPTLFVDKVLESLQPKIIFTAHSHKALVIKMREDSRNDRLITPIEPESTKVYQYDLNDDYLVEIIVPTCSYRMGTTKIGYGFAVLESNKLKYTILWTSSRFLQLKIYGALCIVFFFYYFFRSCCKCKKAETAQYSILEHIA